MSSTPASGYARLIAPDAGEQVLPEPLLSEQPPAGYPGHVQQQQLPMYSYTPKKILYENYRSKHSVILGSIQVVIGILCIVFNTTAIVANNNQPQMIGPGIWCGILFIISGAFGIVAGRTKTKCKVIASMVLSIVASGLCGILLIISLMGLVHANFMSICESLESDHYRYYCFTRNAKNIALAMNSLLMILAAFEICTAIWISTLACKVSCCNNTPQQVMIAAQYIPMLGTSQLVVTNQGQMTHPINYAAAVQYPIGQYPGYQPAAPVNNLVQPGNQAQGPPVSGMPAAYPMAPGAAGYYPSPQAYNDQLLPLYSSQEKTGLP
jgi:uncharacterized membrane protein HdeD (DUF308 family)